VNESLFRQKQEKVDELNTAKQVFEEGSLLVKQEN